MYLELFRELIKRIKGEPNRFQVLRHYCVLNLKRKWVRLVSLIPHTYLNANMKAVKSYRNLHSGDSCFIIGSGPSLSSSDLDKIQGNYSFAVNHIFNVFGETNWRPTYYYNQEINLNNGDVFLNEICNSEFANEFPFSFFPVTSKKNMKKISEKWDCRFLPVFMDFCEYDRKDVENFSTDISSIVYHAYSSLYSVMQIAVYMGFKKIYLLGIDGRYSPGRYHFYPPDDADVDNFLNNDRMCILNDGISMGFQGMYRASLEYGISIVNCSENSSVTLFPYRSLDDVLSEK